jgi:POT family proton-dependent oligopeptide transporter
MFVATVVFWIGRDRYVVVPPAVTEGANKGMAFFMMGLVPVLGAAFWVYSITSNDYRVIAALGTLIGGLVLMVVLGLNTGLRKSLPPQLVDWMEEAFTGPALKQILGLALIYYVFVAMFWSLWDQSNGQTWTLQATSDLMDKHLFGFLAGVPGLSALAGYEMLPSQIQVVNGLFILGMVPIFTFGIYPLMSRFFVVTPLRKIGIGLFVIASSYLIMALIEDRIMHGVVVSLWWQILAYMVLTAAEVLISITALEFSYKQAPLRVKSFIMAATYLLSVSVGNAFTAEISSAMVKPLPITTISAGSDTWVGMSDVSQLQLGQKVDFDGSSGLQVAGSDGQPGKLEGTFLVAEIDAAGSRVRLADPIHRHSVASSGDFTGGTKGASTYKLVGPMYFLFFAGAAAVIAVLFIFVAGFYREKTFVRSDEVATA